MIKARTVNFFLLPFFIFLTCATAAADTIRLQLKWSHQFQFAGYYAAKELGYYRDAGLDVQINQATPTTKVIDDVLQGNAEYGIGNSGLLLARNAGKPVVVLAVIMQHSPFVLIAHQNKPTQSIHDLVNKTIMLEPQADELVAYLQHEGIPLSKFRSVDSQYDLNKFITHQVDAMSAYTTSEPYFLDKLNIKYSVYSPRSAGIDFYGDNLFTTEAELNNHPDRVRAFRAASLRGWQYAMQHQNEIIDLILRKYSKKHDRNFLSFEAEQTRNLMHPELIAIGYMFEGRWQHIGETYASLGMLPENFSLDGFLYQENPKKDFFWFYTALITLSVLSIIFYVALRFSILNKKLLDLLHIKSQYSNVGESINNISHQWKEPLNELAIHLMLIEHKLKKHSEASNGQNDIHQHIDKSHTLLDFMANTVDTFNHLLSTSSVDKTFHPQSTIREIIELVHASFDLKNIVIDYQADGDVQLTGNSRQFAHVILNILHNAQFIFAQRDTKNPHIRIHSYSKQNRFYVDIYDNGGGIRIKPIKSIFKLGVSGKSTEDSGVGLYIARKVIEDRFDGSIEADNWRDGALFSVAVPIPSGEAV